jgi:hypothetical protein
MRLAEQIQQKAKELEKMARSMASAALPKGRPPDKGEVRVILTPEQRKRVAEASGVGIDAVVVDKDVAVFNARMMSMQKHLIERIALQQAGDESARIERKKACEKLAKKLEQSDPITPELQEMIDQLKRDPDKLNELGEEIAQRQKQALSTE